MGEQTLNYYLHDDPRLPSAWGPWFSHEYINYFSAQALESFIALAPVSVKPNPYPNKVDWPLGPKHVDLYKETYSPVRNLDPMMSFHYEIRNGEYSADPPLDKTIEPWKIVVIYSTEPDLHLDCDLNLHKYQKLTGGSHGWRHMQFRLSGMKFGIGQESFRHHANLAEKAFSSDNEYWGWRYLSRCAHYLADLGNPFHVKSAPALLLIRNSPFMICSISSLLRIRAMKYM
jgi:hypothetical protein